MIVQFIKRLILKYGFGRKAPEAPWRGEWAEDNFFSAHKAKTERLASIARERGELKDKLAKAIQQKKARAPTYKALRALSVEELNLEAGR
jgi:hypothetical protein